MTWSPQSSDLNPIEMVWDELDRRVKEKQPTMLSICGNSFKTVGKLFQVKPVKRMPRVCKAVKAKGGYFEESQIKNIFGLFNTFWLLHDSMCYLIILMSSLFFYNVENSRNKEKPLNE